MSGRCTHFAVTGRQLFRSLLHSTNGDKLTAVFLYEVTDTAKVERERILTLDSQLNDLLLLIGMSHW